MMQRTNNQQSTRKSDYTPFKGYHSGFPFKETERIIFMKQFITMLLCTSIFFVINGCSSPIEKTKYYKLEGVALNNISNICSTNCKKLLIQIFVPDYINSNGIIYYSESQGQLTMTSKNLWIEELSTQLKNSLENKINNSNGKYYAFDSRMNVKNDALLQIFIQKFNGEKDGKIVLSGTYIFNNSDTIHQGAFDLSDKQTNDGFEALVAKMNELWIKECDNLIKELL